MTNEQANLINELRMNGSARANNPSYHSGLIDDIKHNRLPIEKARRKYDNIIEEQKTNADEYFTSVLGSAFKTKYSEDNNNNKGVE